MGVLYGYFATVDDDDAGRAIDRGDDQPIGSGLDQFVVKGVDPLVGLAPAVALVTGRSAAEVTSDPRHGGLVAMAGDGEQVVVSLTDGFRDALAAFGPDALRGVATTWAQDEEVFDHPVDPDGLADFLQQLAGLAGRAVARGARLYCWICV